ncbi:MAG: SDR family oxidoreductase [Planctomycetota bacterium]|nr:MAG: SDR family oxidoreductase [Planctomycetota bacterium]
MFENRRFLITGASRGIGRAIAEALADAGGEVLLCARSEEPLRAVADSIRRRGGTADVFVADVADEQQVEAMFEAVRDRYGVLDGLVNNAGGGTERRPVGEDDPTAWWRVVRVNLFGAYLCSRAARPLLQPRGGHILNVGSGMGHQPRAGNSSYNVAKAGLWMFTRCLALEVWDEGICVNELVPGPVHTDLTASVFPPGPRHPTYASEYVKEPDDVAPLALWILAQDPRTGPTGQSFSLARRPIA